MIRVSRNAAGNCVVFYGQTNPVYFNACLTAVVDGDTVSVRNDIASAATETQDNETWEYYRIHFSEWQDGEFNTFASAQEVADYINSIGNVTDVPTGGYTFGPADTLDFTRDETLTSILFSNGDHHGINAVRAVAKDNGRVGITSAVGDFEFYELDLENCSIDGASAGNTLNSVVNNLNAFFTLTAVGAGLDPLPVYTQLDGVDGEWQSAETIVPVGGTSGEDFGYDTSYGSYHGSRVWTSETIDEPGEYWTFELENTVSGGGALAGIGLYSVANGDLDEITNGSLSNSGHHGYWYSQWLYNYSGYTAPWTTYGSNSGLVYGPGWNGATSSQFRYSDSHDDMRGGGTTLFKCGITDAGFVGIWYYDVDRTNDWILLSRSGTPLPAGQYGLLVKLGSTSAIVRSKPRRFATDPAAPVLQWRYIESPDGVFHYPLFATEEEADYVDSLNGGLGESHTHTYVDDPSGTTWYMPDTGGTMSGSSAPTDPKYTGITTEDDASFAPSAYSHADVTQEEGTNINIAITPQDASWSTSVTVSPAGSGLVYNALTGLLQGTLTDVGADTTYTVSVVRANAYGSSTGTFDITATDVAPVNTNDTDWNKAVDFSGSAQRAEMVSGLNNYNPMMMGGTNNQVSTPASGQTTTDGHPWATACVFKVDGHNSNQHIWNLGEGAGDNDDNIYLRLDSSQRLYFGWGRAGDLNELFITTCSSAIWFGVYVGHNGARYGDGTGASGASSGNLTDSLDIRLMSTYDNFGSLLDVSTLAGWQDARSQIGGRQNRQYQGKLSLGGRGSNRSFHGKVASFVTTTLRNGVAMPTDAEITEMITDPVGWLNDYKVGNAYRAPWNEGSANDYSNFQLRNTAGNVQESKATQVYLMGDGSNDSYSNMIRNRVNPGDQNSTKLNLISMVSNDIQTVNISGLS